MAQFDYTLPISLNGIPANIAWVDMSRAFAVYYVYTTDPLAYHPFDEFGNTFTSTDIPTYELQGTVATEALQNSPLSGSDVFYTVKMLTGVYSTSTLDSVISGFEITGIKPMGIIKVICTTQDGVWVSYTSELLDVDEVLISVSN